jgi:acyl transferase domain-containing protein/acyl carrier protein
MSTTPGSIDYRTLLKRAYDTIESLQSQLQSAERAHLEPIAIVGMGLRFPGGGSDAASFWKLLAEGRDVVSEVPPDRWDLDAFYDPDPDVVGKTYSRWGAFLDGIDRFDPHFFGISPREAAGMDPQQRLLLEVSWEALENAGRAGPDLAGSRSGVFVGMVGSDYAHLPGERINEVDAYFGTGISRSIAAGRLSYSFGLQGPAVAVDTACSSSAMATHLACLSLRAGECDMALAGGVNLMLIPGASISASRARMLSPTGRCQAFDAAADGYVRAEGCAMLVLRRLCDAVADRDNILAVILGSVSNQDGRSNGITAPNGQAQEQLLRAALADAGLDPADIDYLEAHGTGTSLGDPIEMKAIGAVFGNGRSPDSPLMVGSVKTNIGHTEAVAGTAGLAKLVLALQQRTVPPHLHLRQPNPHIPWDTLPVTIPTAPTPWSATGGKRRIAGVSSFGFSGTNSHIIVAEPPPVAEVKDTPDRAPRVITLSARNPAALEALAANYPPFLAERPDLRLADVAFTANTGRAHFAERLAVVADSVAEARDRLAGWRDGAEPVDGVVRGTAASGVEPELAFLFTGQGSQYVGMGRELFETEPAFRAAMERCDTLLRPHLDRSLLSILYPKPGEEAEAERLIHQTRFTQPALFALEWSLAQCWRARGIVPSLVMGHSVGEYVAASVAGVFSLQDGLALIAARGRLMQALPDGGAMAAVFADEPTVAAAVAPHADAVSIAAINGPRNIVVSGDGQVVRTILASLAERGIQSRPITVSHAFHSPLMEPMLDRFTEELESVSFAEPRIGLVSNVTGRLAEPEIASAAYWREHVRAPVRFTDAVRTLHEHGCTAFLEIGPAPTLIGMAQRCLSERKEERGKRKENGSQGAAEAVGGGDQDSTWLCSLRAGRGDRRQMLESLGALFVEGAAIDWRAVERDEGQRRVPLPTYPFQRQRYWMELPPMRHAPARPRLHPLLDERLRSPLVQGAVFQSRPGVASPAFLNDHRIFGVPLFPATGFLEMAWAAARQAFPEARGLDAVQIREALALPEDGEATVQVAVSPAADGKAAFRVFSLADDPADEWKLHVEGQVRLDGPPTGGDSTPDAATLDEVRARCTDEFPVGGFYERLAELGVDYGPSFRGLQRIWRRDGEAVARIALPAEHARDAAEFGLHPGLLDACIQLFGAAIPGADDAGAAADVYIPVEIGDFRPLRTGGAALWCQATLERHPASGDVLAGTLRLWDDGGSPVAQIAGVNLKRTSRSVIARLRGAASAERLGSWLYTLAWEPAEAAAPRAGWADGSWLILEDAGGAGARLAARIEAEGGTCLRLPAERLAPATPQAFAALLAEAGNGAHASLRGVVHLGSLDAAEDESADSLLAFQQRTCASTVSLVQAMAGAGIADTGLWLATRGSQAVSGAEPVRPEQAPIWGVANAITLEHPEWRCVCVDLDADPAADPLDALVAELAAADGEDRIAWRGGRRHVARLAPYSRTDRTPEHGEPAARELDIAERGILDNLRLRPATRRQPQRGEVEVEVRASGLNFRDVLNALGMYPGNAGPLGSECAGTVTAVGEGVAGYEPGDAVIALAGGTFRSHVVVPVRSVYPKPAHLSFEEAAGIPIAFLTAYYGLHELAGIRAGDRVLIHAAAGGVGLAAVQLAQRAGAVVFGTAGSDEKRAFLKSIGVQHVMSSRTLHFAEQVMEATGGRGVDIVLNALADDFIPKSLSVLADHGRFLEIGKRGIWTPEQVAQLNPTLRYHAYDLADAIGADAGWMASALDRLMPDFESGALRPLPLQRFPLDGAVDAFRFMAQAKHIGKIVLTQESRAKQKAIRIRDDASYLVTGGLGGLGLAVAGWLVEQGARSLVLTSRRDPSENARQAIESLRQAGARVEVIAADIGDGADVERLMSRIAANLPPLRGVIHAAGVVDDGVLLQQSWPRFQTVMRPKVSGTWLLHTHTRNLPLDYFVLFSTGSALLGSAAQGNYAAANAFLDGVARHRRSLGLPATTINWGAWSEVGMAAALGGRDLERWREHGIGMIAPDEGVRLLDRIVREDVAQVAVLPIEWPRFLAQLGPAGARPLFRRVASEGVNAPRGRAAAAPAVALLGEQLEAADPRQRIELLRQHVEERVRRVLALDASVAIDPGLGFTDLGMDSLMAVELSNHLQASLGSKLPSTLAFEHPTLAALTHFLASEVLRIAPLAVDIPPTPVPTAAADPDRDRLLAVAQLSEDEAEVSLLEELERAGY